MATKIIHKKSSVASSVPSTGDLEPGELAVNLADQKIYSKTTGGAIIEMAPSGVTESIVETAKNVSGVSLAIGAPVYQSGTSGNAMEVQAARADTSSSMPAVGLLNSTLADEAEGSITLVGLLKGLNTTSYSEGDTLYIAATGGLTATPPTGESNLIQNIGKVVKVHASNGSIMVTGAGRSNATPNLDNGAFFLGNGSNQAVATDFDTAVEANSKIAGIEAGATADQTASEILTAIKTVDGSGSGLDADTLDGIGSSLFVYGTNSNKTTNVSNLSTALPSGFYDANNATGSPASGWYTVYNARHNNIGNNYGSQIACSFHDTQNFYVRNISNNSYGAWAKIWNSSNDGSGSGLDADTLDSIQATSFLRSDANDSFSGTITNSGTFVSSHNSSTPSTNLRLGRDGSQYYTFHGSASGNFLTSVSQTSNPKPVLKFGYSIDGGSTLASNYTLNGSSGTIWHTGNDGAGSGLDADTVDGIEASAFLQTSGGTMTGNLSLGDNDQILLGASNDLTIEHNATNGIIANNTNNLYLTNTVQSDDGSGGIANYFAADGSTGEAMLYHYGSEKLNTKSTGVDITGDLTVDTTTLHVDSTNNRVGIGTNAPAVELHIDGSNPQLRFQVVDDTHKSRIEFCDAAGNIDSQIQGGGSLGSEIDVYGSFHVNSGYNMLFADNSELRFGNSNDLIIEHTGSFADIRNGSGHMYIRNFADDSDVYIQSDNGSGATTNYFVADGSTGEAKLYHYGSAKVTTQSDGAHISGGLTTNDEVTAKVVTYAPSQDAPYMIAATTSYTGAATNAGTYGLQHRYKYDSGGSSRITVDGTIGGVATELWALYGTGNMDVYGSLDVGGNVNLGDNGRLRLGSGNDLDIYHDGGNSYIAETGAGALIFRSNTYSFRNSANTEQVMLASENGAVTLYHDNSAKLATSSIGVDVTGSLHASSTTDASLSSTGHAFQAGSTAGLNLAIDTNEIIARNNGAASPLYLNLGSGTTFVGSDLSVGQHVYLGDSQQIRLGASNDLILEHNGSNGVITNNTNHLYLQNTADDKDIYLQTDNGSGGVTNYFMADGSTGEAKMYHYGSEKFATKTGGAEVTGDFTATGNVTAYSDERLKENIKPIENAVDKVKQLRGVTYDWKETGKASVGVIAQEVEVVLPELVVENEEYKSVDYGKLTSVLIEAIKDQQKQIDELKAKLGE